MTEVLTQQRTHVCKWEKPGAAFHFVGEKQLLAPSLINMYVVNQGCSPTQKLKMEFKSSPFTLILLEI